MPEAKEYKPLVEMFCKVDGCDEKHYGNGYCQFHWDHWKRNGSPTAWKYTGKIKVRSDNLRRVDLPDGLATAMCSIFKALP